MRIARHYLVTGFLAASLSSPACAEMPGQEEPQQAPLVKFAPPDVTDIPNDENRNHILLGRRLLAQTKKLLPENVGNGLNCTNCHLGEGRIATCLPLLRRVGQLSEGRFTRWPVGDSRRAHQRLFPALHEWQGIACRFP